ncbi:NAD(P)/FAD-dependent oxidoreductase [Streptomyces sp. AM8-1-1]|uniref:NAD(P)/FAD-dependent oxidoreductase n=1 Tax=Streptomyces sp. AM8-1-1 TaxID=3075825 RepID=UPI0028C413CE|nr:FAD-dependent oxidoreductase [Streptomyces sp. AM8-1-1]WNO71050.1 FAD-dependent oxidoreductase [Streptomyces sp. AM8-1-1]
MTVRTVDVLVVGAGPAGLAAATRLAAAGAGRVEVVEREQQAGGIPRHCCHGGFGLRDLQRPLSGPEYARRLVHGAVRSGARLRTGVTVTGWAGPRTLETVGPAGPETVSARAVVLATGARERSRSARLVPGTRPAGVLTTGELQQAVHLHDQWVGSRAVVVGAEPVAFSAVRTLRASGAETVAMVTEQPRTRVPSLRRPVPLLARTHIVELLGRRRLTGVRLRHEDGRTTTLGCDTIVFTGDWIPDHELARRGGIALDAGTRGPAVDTAFRTAEPGVFAAGNLLHGGERAGIAAEEGSAAAEDVLRHIAGEPWPGPGLPVRVDAPLLWAVPNIVRPHGPRPVRFVLRPSTPLAPPRVLVSQDGRVLHRQQLLMPARPGRPLHLRAGRLDGLDPEGGPVLISL